MTDQARLEANKQVVLEFIRRTFVEHDVDAGLELVREDYIQHNPHFPTGREPMREGFKRFPDVQIAVKRIAADGDLVWVHHHLKTTPDSLGMAIIDIFRVEDGLIAEHWDVMTLVPEEAANGNGMF